MNTFIVPTIYFQIVSQKVFQFFSREDKFTNCIVGAGAEVGVVGNNSHQSSLCASAAQPTAEPTGSPSSEGLLIWLIQILDSDWAKP